MSIPEYRSRAERESFGDNEVVASGRIARVQREIAGSRRAAALYFVGVLVVLAVASTWVNGNAIAYAGVFTYALPIPFTWPIMDAVFTRYSRESVVSALARTRIHWVICVLAGVLLSMLIGGLATS